MVVHVQEMMFAIVPLDGLALIALGQFVPQAFAIKQILFVLLLILVHVNLDTKDQIVTNPNAFRSV
jgi:hypothetical protein